MRIQKTSYQNSNQNQSFGMVSIVGRDEIGKVLLDIVKPGINKDAKIIYGNQFLYGPERGLRQYFVNSTNEAEAEIVKTLSTKGRIVSNVPNSSEKGLSQIEFDEFITKTHIQNPQ